MKAAFQHCAFMAVLVWAVASPLALGATTWYVGDGPTDQKTIQAAVDQAGAGDIIVLKAATYQGTGNCDILLQGKALTIRSTDPCDPQVVEATVIDCAGSAKEPHRGFQVEDCNGVVLSGLTITHGLASAGGAVYCRNSTVNLTYCRILDNATLPGGDTDRNGGAGAGVYGEGSTIQATACFISGNITGAGIASPDGLGGNGGDGAGLFADSIRLVDCIVSFNVAGAGGSGLPSGRGGRGGAICAEMLWLDRCIIEGNQAGAGGNGATSLKDSSGSGGGDGGGLWGVSLEIANSLVTGNRAGRGYAADGTGVITQGNGGGIWCGAGTIRQCTIAENVVCRTKADGIGVLASAGQGAGIFCTANTKITGCILYGNTPDQLAGYAVGNVTFCNVRTPIDASGQLGEFQTPVFILEGAWVNAKDLQTAADPNDPNAVWVPGDYRLQATSPLFDAGDPNYVAQADEKDVSGGVRVADAAIDLGAYESPAVVPLYRFQSPMPFKSFYTTDESEKDWVIQTYSDIWDFEGVTYHVASRPTDPNLRPVYRFWSNLLFSHFYTIDEAEKDYLIEYYPAIWAYERIAFYAYPQGSQPTGTIPVYRLWSNALGGHFYTTDAAEKDARLKDAIIPWFDEGIAWYIYPEGNGGVVEPNTVTYDFTGGAAEAQCSLTLKAFLDGKEAKIDDPNVTYAIDTGSMKMAVDLEAMQATLNDLLVQTTLQAHSATIGGDGAGTLQIPIVLTTNILFWGQTARGPFGIDPNTKAFPTASVGQMPGSGESFTIDGTITVDGNKQDVALVQRADTFATGNPGVFDISAAPGQLSVRMDKTFQWSGQAQPGQEKLSLLLETTVKGSKLQLYVASIEIQTTGVWQGQLPK